LIENIQAIGISYLLYKPYVPYIPYFPNGMRQRLITETMNCNLILSDAGRHVNVKEQIN